MKIESKNIRGKVIALLFGIAFSSTVPVVAQNTKKIIQEFVESYKLDPMALTATFGIRVGDDWWHVHVTRMQKEYKVNDKYTLHNFGPHEATLHDGKPEEPTWYFHFAGESVLEKINSKTWTATTAAMKSFESDKVALEIGSMDGFEESMGSTAILYQTMEHFWKKDAIEITPFGRDNSLPTHGVGAVALYTMKDKRVAWFSIMKDEAANNDRNLEKGQVPNLFVFTKGKGKADFGEGEVDIEEGMSVFIGPYTKHVIYNPYEEPLEGVLILFGDNSDFIFGKSYIDLLDAQYEFYEKN